MSDSYNADMSRQVAGWLLNDKKLLLEAQGDLEKIANSIAIRSEEDSLKRDGYDETLFQACNFLSSTMHNVELIADVLKGIANDVTECEGNVVGIDAMAEYKVRAAAAPGDGE